MNNNEKIAKLYEELLILIGEDKQRDGLVKTPERAMSSLLYLTKGYTERLDDVLNELDIAPNDIIFEGTVGFSGHASEICKQLFSHQLEAGIYLGVDRDSDAFLFSKKKLSQYPHAFLYQTTFDQISTIKQSHQISAFTKLFFKIRPNSSKNFSFKQLQNFY